MTEFCFIFLGHEEDEFNKGIILPNVIVSLKKILDQYPDDGQILKVRLSNASHHIYLTYMSVDVCKLK